MFGHPRLRPFPTLPWMGLESYRALMSQQMGQGHHLCSFRFLRPPFPDVQNPPGESACYSVIMVYHSFFLVLSDSLSCFPGFSPALGMKHIFPDSPLVPKRTGEAVCQWKLLLLLLLAIRRARHEAHHVEAATCV